MSRYRTIENSKLEFLFHVNYENILAERYAVLLIEIHKDFLFCCCFEHGKLEPWNGEEQTKC